MISTLEAAFGGLDVTPVIPPGEPETMSGESSFELSDHGLDFKISLNETVNLALIPKKTHDFVPGILGTLVVFAILAGTIFSIWRYLL